MCFESHNYPTSIIMYWTHHLFSDWPKAFSEFSKSASETSSSCFYQGHSRSLVIMSCMTVMSSSHFLCSCLSSVKKQKHEFHFFDQCVMKQLLDSLFVISRIIKVLARVVSLIFILWLWLTARSSSLIILDITKNLFNFIEIELTIDLLSNFTSWLPIRQENLNFEIKKRVQVFV